MKRIIVLLALLAAGWGDTHAAPASTNSAPTNRILMIDPSSMPIAAGKATLTIGALQRADGVYSGDYKIKVFPYFLQNEKGRLAIVVSDESLAEINQGKAAAIVGTATTSGKGGRSRHIDATATPADINRGTLKLWFTTAGNRKMIFEPAYHFAEKGTAAVRAHLDTATGGVWPSPAAASHGFFERAEKLPPGRVFHVAAPEDGRTPASPCHRTPVAMSGCASKVVSGPIVVLSCPRSPKECS
jgi:hypothetical protein